MAAASIYVLRVSSSCLLPLVEPLQDQQEGLIQAPFKLLLLPRVSECVRFGVCPLRVESLFYPLVLLKVSHLNFLNEIFQTEYIGNEKLRACYYYPALTYLKCYICFRFLKTLNSTVEAPSSSHATSKSYSEVEYPYHVFFLILLLLSYIVMVFPCY